MHTTTLTPKGQFDLVAAIEFLRGFGPVDHNESGDGHTLLLPLVVEGEWLPAVVEVSDVGDGDLAVTAHGPGAGNAAITQIRRVLSLDLDPAPFDKVCDADPVLAEARGRHPVLRPVLFPSVYESLAWAILSQRTRMASASAAKARIAQTLGQVVDVSGEEVAVFPEPARLSSLEPMKGVTETKAARLRGLAAAVVNDDVTAARIVAAPDALEQLQQIDGVGPFSAELALVRGAGALDHLPGHEARLDAIVRDGYDLADDNKDGIAKVAEAWRPYRSWAAFLLRADAARA